MFSAAALLVFFWAATASGGSALTGPARALAALHALESATLADLNYSDYHARFVDATIAVDAAARDGGGSQGFWRAVREALAYYSSARNLWTIAAKLGDTNFLPAETAERLRDTWLGDECEALRALGPSPGRIDAPLLTHVVIPAEWSCAAKRLAEAERLAR